MVNCKHWRSCGVKHGGCCAHPAQPHGERPSFGVCNMACQVRRPRRSAKDAVKTVRTAARKAAHGAKSIAQTSLGIHRASDQVIEARLNVCRNCPGNHAVWKRGKQAVTPATVEERDKLRASGAEVHTCGPMLESLASEGEATCGCVLSLKARDIRETCPNGYWPDPGSDPGAGVGSVTDRSPKGG